MSATCVATRAHCVLPADAAQAPFFPTLSERGFSLLDSQIIRMRIIGRWWWYSVAGLLTIGGGLLACGSQSDEAGTRGSGNATAGFASVGGAGVGGAIVDQGGGRAGASAGSSNSEADAGGGSTGVAAAGAQTGGAAGSGAGSAGSAGALAGAAGSGGGLTSCDAPLSDGDIANLTASEQVETYSIMGSTATALRSSINANRGHEYDAQTNWYIEWSVENCAAPKWSVSLTIDYSMPNWNAPAGADPVLVAQWRSYLSALYCHEYGHGKLGLDCANRIYDDLAGVPGNDDCSVVTTAAKARFQAILSDCQALEASYDAQTNHGATMGAVFPP